MYFFQAALPTYHVKERRGHSIRLKSPSVSHAGFLPPLFPFRSELENTPYTHMYLKKAKRPKKKRRTTKLGIELRSSDFVVYLGACLIGPCLPEATESWRLYFVGTPVSDVLTIAPPDRSYFLAVRVGVLYYSPSLPPPFRPLLLSCSMTLPFVYKSLFFIYDPSFVSRLGLL